MINDRKNFKVKNCGHFYATSICQWKVSENMEELVSAMKKDGFIFVVFWVPLPVDAEYEINSFSPDVKGCVKIAEYTV